MATNEDRPPRVAPPAAPAPKPDQDDQLSPRRSLRESAGRAGSQRIGNNGPVANPEVSFPEEAEEPEPEKD